MIYYKIFVSSSTKPGDKHVEKHGENYSEDRKHTFTSQSEDLFFTGVFDGFFGQEVAEKVSKKLIIYIMFSDFYPDNIESAIQVGFELMKGQLEHLIRNRISEKKDVSGTTAAIVIIHQGKLYTANLGVDHRYAR